MAAPPVGTGDPTTQSMLNDAYSSAKQSLGSSVPSNLLQPYQGAGAASTPANADWVAQDAPSGAEAPVSDADAPPGAENPFDQYQKPPEGAEPVADPNTHGNGDAWSLSNMGDFLRDEFKGTGEELGKALPRMLAKSGGFATMGVGGIAALADKTVSAIIGKPRTTAEDAVFDFHKDFIQPAIDHWTPERAAVTGQGEGTGGGAQALGDVAGFVPKLAMGPAAAVDIAAESGIDTAKESLDKGQSLRVAAANGAVDAVANGLQAMVPGHALPLVKRLLVQVPAGDFVAVAGDYAKKQILQANGEDKAAAEINPLEALPQDTLQNIVFGLLGGRGGKKETAPGAAAPPVPEAQPVPSGVQPPPPLAPSVAPAPRADATPAKPTSQPAAAVPDTPSPEPAKDLKAQFADMNDKATPRTGVLVPKGSEGSVGNSLKQADAQGRVLYVPQGALILKNKAEFLKAQNALGKGEDVQAIIGRVTGAGEGKQPDQTAVVQGQTPAGAVATESMVKPEEVAAKVAEVKAQGNEPVVTTPQAAVDRRQIEIHKESQEKPPEGAEPVAEAKPSDEDVEEQAPTAERAIVKTAGGERAVHVVDAKPDAEGKVKVRLLDEDGEPSDQVVSVPKEALRGGAGDPKDAREEPAATPPEKAAEPSAVTEPTAAAPEKPAKPAPLLEQLADARDSFKEQSTLPKGRKYPGSVKDRAGNVANFARVLKGVAEHLTGKAPVADIQAAIAVAKKAERLDLKSDEAIAKNQGVGHTELAVHEHNLTQAAEKLINPDHVVEPAKSAIQEKLKAKQAAKAEGKAKPTLADKIADRNALRDAPFDGEAEQAAYKKYWATLEARGESKQAIREEMDKILQDRAARKPDSRTPEEIQAFNDRVLGKKPEKIKVIADVPDETKPKQLSKSEQQRIKVAGDKFIKAKDEDLDARRSDIDKIIQDIYGDKMSPDDHETLMNYLTAERRDRMRPKSRDEEIDDEFRDNMREDNGDHHDELEHRVLGAHEVSPEMAAMHARLERSGMYPKMREAAARNLQFPARDMLLHMAASAHNAPLQDFIKKLAYHMPDGAVIRPVEQISHRNGRAPGENEAGLASATDNTIQIRMKTAGDSRLTHTMLHEAVHLATMHLAAQDPSHPFVREAKRLRQIFEDRLRRRLGDQVVQDHIDHYRGTGYGGPPKDFIANLYGLKNHLEFMAEAMSNPKFQQLIAESEAHRGNNEGFIGGVHKLADAVVGAIKRALNIVSNKEAKLLHAVMRNVEDIMDSQRTLLDTQRPEAREELESLAHLDDDPKPLKDEPRLRGIIGDTAADTTRQFVRSTQARAIHILRKLVLTNETHDQIIRSNAHWFGHDNEANPLRQYEDLQQQKTAISNNHLERAKDTVRARQQLDRATDKALGEFQIDSTRWGIDPTKDKDAVPAKLSKGPGFEKRWDEMQERWKALPDGAKHVYQEERDHYAWAQRQLRRTAVDAALDTFSDRDITAAQRSLLYNARTKGDFEGLIGGGKLVDVGDRNDSLKKSLQELAAVNQIDGPYFHLGRHGEYVVQVHPEGSKDFNTQAEAEDYADKIRAFGPSSKAKVAELGGKWNVDYTAHQISMHDNSYAAEAEREKLVAAGHKVGPVTRKIESQSGGALSSGMQALVAAAGKKLERNGAGVETKALTDALRGTFVQMVAARSAYASSKLARQGFGGVKGEEMGRNFAAHTQSMAYNIGNLATTFKQGEALGKIREAAKNPDADTPQKTVYKRGAVMDILGKRMAQEVSQYGMKNPINAVSAKLGYLNYLASPMHTVVNLTQNFTTAIPVAGPRWGYGRTIAAFGRASNLVTGPTFRALGKALIPGHFTADDMAEQVVKAVSSHPTLGKWAPQLRELMNRGIIGSTFATELGHAARGGSVSTQRIFDYARTMPQFAEVYNRVTTALAGLELSGGDLQKTAGFIKESHVDYSQSNKTYLAKTVAKVPAANTLTMFRTYIQGMRHLLYSNIKNMVYAETKSRAEAAKTVAGLIVAQSLFAGVIKGAAIEPLRAAVYAYNKLFGDSDEYYSLDNSIRRFVAGAAGKGKAADAITGGLPHLLGFDLSGRMGLSDLFLHDPPDMLAADTKTNLAFAGMQLGGPMVQMVADNKEAFVDAQARGDAFGMLASLVPIKILRDALHATELATTGKRAGNGARLTAPSGVDAALQLMGAKPADVARAQEKQGDVAQYRDFVSERKQRLMKAYAQADADKKPSIIDEVKDFNAKNPANRIKVQDFIKQRRAAMRTQMRMDGGPEKDPNVRKLLDY